MRQRELGTVFADLERVCALIRHSIDTQNRLSLQEVASNLGIKASTLSKAVEKVETDLGVEVFRTHRKTKALQLARPDEAKELLARLEQLLADYTSLKNRWHGQRVIVGAFPSLITRLSPEVVSRVLKDYPLDVEIIFRTGDINELFRLLAGRLVDIVIAAHSGQAGEEFFREEIYSETVKLGILYNKELCTRDLLALAEGKKQIDLEILMKVIQELPLFLVKDQPTLGPHVEVEFLALLKRGEWHPTKRPPTLTYLPTYFQLTCCLECNAGVALGPDEGHEKLGFIRLDRIRCDENTEAGASFKKVLRLSEPSYSIYLRHGFQLGLLEGGLPPAGRALVEAIKAVAKQLIRHRYTM